VKPVDVAIERADASHIDGILKLADENAPERGGELTGSLQRPAVEEAIYNLPCIVACSEGRVVGFVLSWEKHASRNACVRAMLEAYPGPSDAYVYGPVCVEASARGLGISTKMFEKLRELLPHREGILFIKATNESSLRAHRKMGMRKTAKFIFDGKEFFVFTYRP
jgi:GNAT superfamily N-acetyltransferase